MIAVTRRRTSTNLWSRLLKKFTLSQVLLFSWATMMLNLSQMLLKTGNLSPTALIGYSIFLVSILMCAYLYAWESPRRQLVRLQRLLDRVGLWPIAWLVSFLVFLLDGISVPVFAGTTTPTPSLSSGFFFTNIQTKINGIFAGTNAAAIVPITKFGFGVLQVLFIVYIAWAVSKVIGSSREEEDWKQAAKTPLIVAAGVFGGDYAIGLV